MNVPSLVLQMATDTARVAADMEHVKRTVGGAMDHVSRTASVAMSALKGLAGALLAGLSIAAIKSFIDETVKATAALDDMAEKTGGTVEGLSVLRSAAKLSGTDVGAVEGALIKLAKGMSAADDKSKGFGAALNHIGLSARDASGNLKSTDAMFLEISQKFALFADGAGKTALALELFGKAGAQMLPVLKDLAEAGEYDIRVTTAQASAADEYEKNLTRLSTAKTAVWRQIVMEMIPAMDSLAKFFLELYKQSGGWRDQLKKLAEDGSIKQWANDAVMAFAKALDSGASFFNKLEQWGTSSAIVLANLLEHIARLGTGGIANPLSNYFAKNQQELNAYLEKLKADGAKAQGYYQQIMGNMIGQQGQGGGAPKPKLNFTAANDEAAKALKAFNDEILKRMDLLRKAGDLERSIAEATAAVRKNLLEHELYDYKAQLDAKELSERQFIEKTRDLRVKMAEENQARLQKELADQKRILEEMIALQSQLRGKDATETAALQAQAQQKIIDQQIKINKLTADERIAAEQVRLEWQKGGDALGEYGRKVEAIVKAQQQGAADAVRAIQDQTDAEQLQLSLIGATTVQHQTANAMYALGNKLRDNRIAQEREIASYGRNIDPEVLAAINAKYRDINEALLKQNSLQVEGIKRTEEARQHVENLRNAWQAIDSTVFDVFESILTKGTDTWKKLTDTLKKTLIRALYEMTVQRWTMSVLADIVPGAAGILAGQSGGGVVGAANSLFSGASSASSLYTGGTTAWNWLTGSGAAGSASGVTGVSTAAGAGIASGATVYGAGGAVAGYGGAAVAGEGAGIALAAGAGAEAGALAAGAAWVPVVGWIVAIAALAYAIFAASDEPTPVRAGLSFRGPYEDNVPPTQTAFGAIGFGDSSTQQFSGVVGQAFTTALGQLLDMGAKQLKPETVQAISDYLKNTTLLSFEGTFSTEDFLNNFGPQMARQLLDPVLQAIDPYAAKLVADFKGPLDELLAFAGDILTVTGLLSEKSADFTRLFGEAINLEALDGVRKEGESFGQALQRVATAFQVTNDIALLMGKSQEEVWGAVGLASLAAREKLIEFAGGADALSASLASYYNNYFTDAEKQVMQQKQLADSFKAIGVEMPTTLQGFRDLVQGLDLTKEADQKLFAELMKVQGPFADYIKAIKDTGEAAEEAALRLAPEGRPGLDGIGDRNVPLPTTPEPSQLSPAEQDAINDAKKIQLDLERQLFVATHSSNEVRERDRQLRLDELTVLEQQAGLAPGTLTSIQNQINAQEDLNEAANKAAAAVAATANQLRAFQDSRIGGATEADMQFNADVAFAAMNALIPAMTRLGASVELTAEQFLGLTEEQRDAVLTFRQANNALLNFTNALIPRDATGNPLPAGGYWDFTSGYGVWRTGSPSDPATPPAAADPNDLLLQHLGLLAQKYELTGDKVAAHAILLQQQAIALQRLDPNLRALQQEIWDLEAAAKAAAKALEFTKAKEDLRIQILRAQGKEAEAVEMERAQLIAQINEQWGAGTVQAIELIAMYRELWAIQGEVVTSGSNWVKQLQDWLAALQLDQSVSPLKPRERFDFAQQQYIENLMKAQGGDGEARAQFTQYADAYLREAVGMFTTASQDYQAIWQAIQDQTNGLIAQGLGPSAPATMSDLNSTMQSGWQTAEQQTSSLIAEIQGLRTQVATLTQRVQEGNDGVLKQTEDLTEAYDTNSNAIVRSVQTIPTSEARLT